MSRHTPFVQLFLARIREFLREPEVVFWVFGFPLLLAVGLGVAFRNKPPDEIVVGILKSEAAAATAGVLRQDAGFRASILGSEEASRQLRLGKVSLLVVPGDTYEYRYDPTRPESVLARQMVHDALERAAGRTDRVEVRETLITQPGARYIDFLIPGLLGMNIMSGGMWGVGFVLVDMRSRKLLKRLVATPMPRSHFLGSMMASRMLFVFIEMLLMLAFGWLVFSLVIMGSLGAIFLLTILGSFVFAGIGLLVGSRTQKIETISGLMNLVMLPMFVFSGIFFSSERFPEFLQPFIKALPLTALNDALRATILEGASLASQSGRIGILIAWGTLAYLGALKLFKWT